MSPVVRIFNRVFRCSDILSKIKMLIKDISFLQESGFLSILLSMLFPFFWTFLLWYLGNSLLAFSPPTQLLTNLLILLWPRICEIQRKKVLLYIYNMLHIYLYHNWLMKAFFDTTVTALGLLHEMSIFAYYQKNKGRLNLLRISQGKRLATALPPQTKPIYLHIWSSNQPFWNFIVLRQVGHGVSIFSGNSEWKLKTTLQCGHINLRSGNLPLTE